MRVGVHCFEAGLVHMLMCVGGPVIVGVRVLVLNVIVFVGGVRMGVRDIAVSVFVSMRRIVCVLGCHDRPLPMRNVLFSVFMPGWHPR